MPLPPQIFRTRAFSARTFPGQTVSGQVFSGQVLSGQSFAAQILAAGAFFATLTLAVPGAALAQAAVSESQILAGPCASCHGPDGRSPGAIPSIAGLPEADLVEKLTAFRDAPPLGTTVMGRHMKGYDDAQIAALAKFFAEVTP